jgi:hypothetical protein
MIELVVFDAGGCCRRLSIAGSVDSSIGVAAARVLGAAFNCIASNLCCLACSLKYNGLPVTSERQRQQKSL